MVRFYALFKALIMIVLLAVAALWVIPHRAPISYGAAPGYETQASPVNGGITIERRPTLRWLIFPNGNQIKDAKLSLNGQIVSLQQIATGNAVALTYQPTTDLTPGNHTMEYILTIAGFQSITLSSSFVIADKGPDLYDGKDRLKFANMETQALTVLNSYRQKLGLIELLKNDRLSMSAQAHANYQTLNHVQSHYERQGTPGFTGVTPQSRGTFYGYTGQVGEGISFASPVDSIGIDRLMDAPYHRLGHINPNYHEAGIAFSLRPESTIVDYGTPGISNDSRVMLYPYPGQIDAKIAWFAAEDPNPLARYGQDKVTVGYPISLSIYDDQAIEFKTLSATLTDDKQQNVAFYLVDSTQETEHKCHVFLIPIQPLSAGKTYTASVSGVQLQKDNSTIPLNRTWSFSTLGQLAIRHIGVITLANDDYVEVITKNGDLPDLNYTLSMNGNKIRGYIGQERKYYSYDRSVLKNGEYTLDISSNSFLQKLTYKVLIDGSGEDRRVTIIN